MMTRGDNDQDATMLESSAAAPIREISMHESELGKRSKRAQYHLNCSVDTHQCYDSSRSSLAYHDVPGGAALDDSWSDPSIRWIQNKHDGITQAALPSRSPSTHRSPRWLPTRNPPPAQLSSKDSSCSSNGLLLSLAPPAKPMRQPSRDHSTSLHMNLFRDKARGLPPKLPSKDSSCYSSGSASSSVPRKPQRKPSNHASLLIFGDESVSDDESISSFFGASVANGKGHVSCDEECVNKDSHIPLTIDIDLESKSNKPRVRTPSAPAVSEVFWTRKH